MENLIEVRDKLSSLSVLQEKMGEIDNLIEEDEKEVHRLLLKYEKEKRDVAHIQKKSLSSFARKMAKKYDAHAEKQIQDEVSAKLNYDKAAADLESLKAEKKDLIDRILELLQISQHYEAALEKRRKYLDGNLSEPDGLKYLKLESDRDLFARQKTEIAEAVYAASVAREAAEDVKRSLQKAGDWAFADMWMGSGIISYIFKYSHINAAEDKLSKLNAKLKFLELELKDVNQFCTFNLTKITAFEHVIDLWFDNFFTDYFIRKHIHENIDEINRLISYLLKIKELLKNKMTELDARLDENKKAQEDFLVSVHIK
ncbi:hypothetical protein [Methanolapillus millepedarum]|uniref:Uncharacterized protein n=1 Tax=Methanolapillus millepedarum TaxID=3028296 RepID=A0AA96V398_9EURY|nr:hypothetical protein MsAc7_06310 [Methanosarcinaceae archaeon Ac7]